MRRGEILCLLGPSGCGKTTLLRIIAGLERPAGGSLTLDGADICRIPAHQRQFGLMFQDYALFPHMTVAGNVAYGLKRQGFPRQTRESRVDEMLGIVGLAGLGERDVAALSGGQQQRVALARSLAPNPRLLMLDEPLGSLDARLREQLALELRDIIKRRGLSAIYVTHDHREAYAVADRIAVMNIGTVVQVGAPQHLYRRPQSRFVAEFLGLRNIFRADASEFARQLARAAKITQADGLILVHPGGIRIGEAGPTELAFVATVLRTVFRGESSELTVEVAPATQLTFSARETSWAVGARVNIAIQPDCIIQLDE